MSLSIQALTPAELDDANAIVMAAYGSASREAELARYLTMQPDGWLLARAGDAPAGTGGAIDYGPFAYIGLMAVAPWAQRRGVGRALLTRLLAWLELRGCGSALLDATEAGYPLYRSLGFAVDDTVDVWVREPGERREHGAPAAGSGVECRALNADDLPALAAYDADRFGANRQRVLASYLAEAGGRAIGAFAPGGGMTGFLFARATRADMLGPWMADEEAAAEALLCAALALPGGGALSVQTPTANTAGGRLLARYGFQIGRTLRHMRRGGVSLVERRDRIYGQASFALG